MSNGESKIAIFKAALCCGFAIALRAFFIGDSMPLDCFASLAMTQGHVIASEQRERGKQQAKNPKEVSQHA